MDFGCKKSVILGCLFSLTVILVLLFENVSIFSSGQNLAKDIIRPFWGKNGDNDDDTSVHGLILHKELSNNELLQFKENNTVYYPKFIFLSSYWRSGSTFLGQVLGFRSDVFYYLEPLVRLVKRKFTKGARLCDMTESYCEYSHDSLGKSLRFLSDVFNCRLQNHSKSVNQALIKRFSGPKWKSFNECVAKHKKVEECLVKAEQQCLSIKYRVVKVLRMSLQDVALLLPKHPNLVIVHLFRDPRGTLNSHVHTKWFPMKMKTLDAFVNDTKALCERIRNDLAMGITLKTKFPDRVKLVQYEDIYGNVEKAKILYKLLGMDLLQESEEYLSTLFHVEDEKTNKSSYLTGGFKYREDKKERVISNSERTKWYAEMKKQRRATQKYESKKRLTDTNKPTVFIEKTKAASLKRQERRKRAKERMQYERDRKRKWRAQKKQTLTVDMPDYQSQKFVFKHRNDKKRALDKLKQSLPDTPIKRCAVLKSYLTESKSPTAKNITTQMVTPTDEVANSVLKNIKEIISTNKLKRSKEKRTETHAIIASVSGENLTQSRSKTKLARRLGVSVKTISGGQRLRTKLITSSKSCYEHTKHKWRSDGVTDEQKSVIYNFWISPQVSRPTGNKKDVKRHRIGPKTYLSQCVQILEKTQTEAYTDFNTLHPNINISQRTFEKYKPFFVKPVRVKDKCTCCCRYHVEFGHAFRRCMQLRTALLKKYNINSEEYPVFDHSVDLIEKTLCDRVDGHFCMPCLNRECTVCGVRENLFMPRELDASESAEEVDWERYEYRNFTYNGTQIKRKLVLVKKNTKIGELYQHLISLLGTFPSHNFRADWQHTQAKRLIETLPVGDVLVVHDFSENYRCTEKHEIQSSYFQKTEVSIHVSIIYRHAILEYDGVESMPHDPQLIREQFFVISPDKKHDHHFTFHVQTLVHDHLMSMSYPLATIHEYTDGCAAQYKSRHCFGSLTLAATKFNCTIIRNFYETSHAKGPQDAAGGYLKQQADLAVLRGKTVIQSAKDFFEFISSELSTPKEAAICKSRIFRYVPEIPRNEACYYKQIISIRKIHQVIATSSNTITCRWLSCYSCDSCFHGYYQNCEYLTYTGAPTFTRLVIDDKNEPVADMSDLSDTCITNLIQKGHILAVRAENDEFYLLEAKSEPFTLTMDKTDDYQTTYVAGTSVIKGLYYERMKKSIFEYRLLPKHIAFVPTLSVLRICSEVQGKRIKLNEDVHQTIVNTLDEIA